MKDQYVGDQKDYYKYSILRHLATDGFRPCICWMWTPPGKKTDGGNTEYLEGLHLNDGSIFYPWRKHDPPVFDALQNCVANSRRKVSEIEGHALIPCAAYFSEEFPKSLGKPRADFFSRFHGKLNEFEDQGECFDLIFFDPDKGLRERSRPGGNPSQNLFFDELSQFFLSAYAVLVIQFPWNETDFEKRWATLLVDSVLNHTGVDVSESAWFFDCRTLPKKRRDGGKAPPGRVFFYLLGHERHFGVMGPLVASFEEKWQNAMVGKLGAITISPIGAYLQP